MGTERTHYLLWEDTRAACWNPDRLVGVYTDIAAMDAHILSIREDLEALGCEIMLDVRTELQPGGVIMWHLEWMSSPSTRTFHTWHRADPVCFNRPLIVDGCEICDGSREGVPGNENVIEGVVMCDYCHADTMASRGKREEGQWIGWK